MNRLFTYLKIGNIPEYIHNKNIQTTYYNIRENFMDQEIRYYKK